MSFSQTTDIVVKTNEVSVYKDDNVSSRFILPQGSEFIGWNNECVLIKIGSDIRTFDHQGRPISSLNLGHREFVRISPSEIVIREDNNFNYYNSRFISIRKIPIRF